MNNASEDGGGSCQKIINTARRITAVFLSFIILFNLSVESFAQIPNISEYFGSAENKFYRETLSEDLQNQIESKITAKDLTKWAKNSGLITFEEFWYASAYENEVNDLSKKAGLSYEEFVEMVGERLKKETGISGDSGEKGAEYIKSLGLTDYHNYLGNMRRIRDELAGKYQWINAGIKRIEDVWAARAGYFKMQAVLDKTKQQKELSFEDKKIINEWMIYVGEYRRALLKYMENAGEKGYGEIANLNTLYHIGGLGYDEVENGLKYFRKAINTMDNYCDTPWYKSFPEGILDFLNKRKNELIKDHVKRAKAQAEEGIGEKKYRICSELSNAYVGLNLLTDYSPYDYEEGKDDTDAYKILESLKKYYKNNQAVLLNGFIALLSLRAYSELRNFLFSVEKEIKDSEFPSGLDMLFVQYYADGISGLGKWRYTNDITERHSYIAKEEKHASLGGDFAKNPEMGNLWEDIGAALAEHAAEHAVEYDVEYDKIKHTVEYFLKGITYSFNSDTMKWELTAANVPLIMGILTNKNLDTNSGNKVVTNNQNNGRRVEPVFLESAFYATFADLTESSERALKNKILAVSAKYDLNLKYDAGEKGGYKYNHSKNGQYQRRKNFLKAAGALDILLMFTGIAATAGGLAKGIGNSVKLIRAARGAGVIRNVWSIKNLSPNNIKALHEFRTQQLGFNIKSVVANTFDAQFKTNLRNFPEIAGTKAASLRAAASLNAKGKAWAAADYKAAQAASKHTPKPKPAPQTASAGTEYDWLLTDKNRNVAAKFTPGPQGKPGTIEVLPPVQMPVTQKPVYTTQIGGSGGGAFSQTADKVRLARNSSGRWTRKFRQKILMPEIAPPAPVRELSFAAKIKNNLQSLWFKTKLSVMGLSAPAATESAILAPAFKTQTAIYTNAPLRTTFSLTDLGATLRAPAATSLKTAITPNYITSLSKTRALGNVPSASGLGQSLSGGSLFGIKPLFNLPQFVAVRDGWDANGGAATSAGYRGLSGELTPYSAHELALFNLNLGPQPAWYNAFRAEEAAKLQRLKAAETKLNSDKNTRNKTAEKATQPFSVFYIDPLTGEEILLPLTSNILKGVKTSGYDRIVFDDGHARLRDGNRKPKSLDSFYMLLNESGLRLAQFMTAISAPEIGGFRIKLYKNGGVSPKDSTITDTKLYDIKGAELPVTVSLSSDLIKGNTLVFDFETFAFYLKNKESGGLVRLDEGYNIRLPKHEISKLTNALNGLDIIFNIDVAPTKKRENIFLLNFLIGASIGAFAPAISQTFGWDMARANLLTSLLGHGPALLIFTFAWFIKKYTTLNMFKLASLMSTAGLAVSAVTLTGLINMPVAAAAVGIFLLSLSSEMRFAAVGPLAKRNFGERSGVVQLRAFMARALGSIVLLYGPAVINFITGQNSNNAAGVVLLALAAAVAPVVLFGSRLRDNKEVEENAESNILKLLKMARQLPLLRYGTLAFILFESFEGLATTQAGVIAEKIFGKNAPEIDLYVGIGFVAMALGRLIFAHLENIGRINKKGLFSLATALSAAGLGLFALGYIAELTTLAMTGFFVSFFGLSSYWPPFYRAIVDNTPAKESEISVIIYGLGGFAALAGMAMPALINAVGINLSFLASAAVLAGAVIFAAIFGMFKNISPKEIVRTLLHGNERVSEAGKKNILASWINGAELKELLEKQTGFASDMADAEKSIPVWQHKIGANSKLNSYKNGIISAFKAAEEAAGAQWAELHGGAEADVSRPEYEELLLKNFGAALKQSKLPEALRAKVFDIFSRHLAGAGLHSSAFMGGRFRGEYIPASAEELTGTFEPEELTKIPLSKEGFFMSYIQSAGSAEKKLPATLSLDNNLKIKDYNRIMINESSVAVLRDETPSGSKNISHFYLELKEPKEGLRELVRLAKKRPEKTLLVKVYSVALKKKSNIKTVTLRTANSRPTNIMVETTEALVPQGYDLVLTPSGVLGIIKAGERLPGPLNDFYVRIPKNQMYNFAAIIEGSKYNFKLHVGTTSNKADVIVKHQSAANVSLGKTLGPVIGNSQGFSEAFSTILSYVLFYVMPLMAPFIDGIIKKYGEDRIMKAGFWMSIISALGVFAADNLMAPGLLRTAAFLASIAVFAAGLNLRLIVNNILISLNSGASPSSSAAKAQAYKKIIDGAGKITFKDLTARVKEIFTGRQKLPLHDLLYFNMSFMFKNLGTLVFLALPFFANPLLNLIPGAPSLDLGFSTSFLFYSFYSGWVLHKIYKANLRDSSDRYAKREASVKTPRGEALSVWEVLKTKESVASYATAMTLSTIHEIVVSTGYSSKLNELLSYSDYANLLVGTFLYVPLFFGRALWNMALTKMSQGSTYILSSICSLLGTILMAAYPSSAAMLTVGAATASLGISNFFGQMYSSITEKHLEFRRQISLILTATLSLGAIFAVPATKLMKTPDIANAAFIYALAALVISVLVLPRMVENSSIYKYFAQFFKTFSPSAPRDGDKAEEYGENLLPGDGVEQHPPSKGGDGPVPGIKKPLPN